VDRHARFRGLAMTSRYLRRFGRRCLADEQAAVAGGDAHAIAVLDAAGENGAGQRVLQAAAAMAPSKKSKRVPRVRIAR
jgi:hypothetical protein